MSTVQQRAASRRARREKIAQQHRPGEWFPVDWDCTRECTVCHEPKHRRDFGRVDGQWHSETCKACRRKVANADRVRSRHHDGVRPGEVKAYLCPWCRSQGIIALMAYAEGPCHPDCGYGRRALTGAASVRAQ